MPVSPSSPRSRTARSARQRGFSFIEILVVMGIMTLLATMVVVLIPIIRERANQAKSKDNVTSLVSMLLVISTEKGGYPAYGGKCFTLSPIAYGVLNPDAPGACEVFFSPGDDYLKLDRVGREKFRDINKQMLKNNADVREYTSYAGRRNGDKGCVMAGADTSEQGTLMLCDDDDGPLHHASGLVVGFRDGKVVLKDWEELGMPKPKDVRDFEPFLGDSAQSPLLKCLANECSGGGGR